MPITLNDAIERAKLAADPDGLLSAYTYDQLITSLDETDRYAFTMALVDIGIFTKKGSKVGEDHVKEVLGFVSQEVSSENHSLIDKFLKVSQQFFNLAAEDVSTEQNPRGTSDFYPEWFRRFSPEAEDEENIEQPAESKPVVQNAPEPAQQPLESSEFDTDEVDHIRTILENYGVSVSSDGKVSLYKQNLPGLFDKKIPIKSLSLDEAVKLFSGELQNAEVEKQRISKLQDVLASLGGDFSEMSGSASDLLRTFEESLQNLEQFKYSEKSPNKSIKEIAEGIATIKSYLSNEEDDLSNLKYYLDSNEDFIGNLQGKLDEYFQTQYDKHEQKLEIVDALTRLSQIKNEDPKMFSEIVSNLGGIVGAFLKANKKGWIEDEEDYPRYGSLDINVGIDYLRNVLGSDEIFDEFMKEYAPNGEFIMNDSYWINDLKKRFDVGSIGNTGGDLNINFVDGNKVEGFLTRWYRENAAPEIGQYSPGYSLDEIEEIKGEDLNFLIKEINEFISNFN